MTNKTYLVRTITGTIRLMSEDEMYLEDIDRSIMRAFKFLNGNQKNDLYEGYKTVISDKQATATQGLV